MRALAAAAALHAAILALLIVDWSGPALGPEPSAVPVALVTEPPHENMGPQPEVVSPPSPPDQSANEAALPDPPPPASPPGSGEGDTAPEIHGSAPANPDPHPQEPAATAKPPHHTATVPQRSVRKKPAPPPAKPPRAPPLDGVAEYNVVLEPSGAIRAVILVQSSGNTAFDEAGERMIRASMRFPASPPNTEGDGLGHYAVSLRFTPERP